MKKQKIYKYIAKQKKYNQILKKCSPILIEQDFYPPSDDRVLMSNIKDIKDGDNFADYCKDFFELLDEEEFFDGE